MMLLLMKIQGPQQVPGCPSCLPTSCMQMFLLGWGRGTVAEELAFLLGKGKGHCVHPSWGTSPYKPDWARLQQQCTAACSPIPSAAGSPGPTRSISTVMAHKDTALASLWLKQNVNSNILAIPFPLHRHSAHRTQPTLTLGRSLTLWGLLMYPPVYLRLARATDVWGGFTHESLGRDT